MHEMRATDLSYDNGPLTINMFQFAVKLANWIKLEAF